MISFVLLLHIAAQASPSQCSDALKNELISVFDLAAHQSDDISPLLRFYYSGKDINDLGHYDACVRRLDSRYLVCMLHTQAVPLSIGLCVPKACDAESFADLLPIASDSSMITIQEPSRQPMHASGVITLVLLGVLTVSVLVGTILGNDESPGLLSHFSLRKNWKELTAEPVKDNSRILNGVKVMSMGWVLLGHLYGYRMISIVNNVEMLPEILAADSTVFGYGGFFAVDTFFWAGGFLMAYLLVTDSKKKRTYPWVLIILLRVLRLWPVYIVCILLRYGVAPYLGYGPKWSLFAKLGGECDKFWWTNLLFINNLYPEPERACIGAGWYLANDMQFFVLSIGLLICYKKFAPAFTWIAVVVLCIFSIVWSFLIADEFNFKIWIGAPENTGEGNFMRDLYQNPLCRYPTYLIGVLAGIVYSEYKNKSQTDPVARRIADSIANSGCSAVFLFIFGCGLFNSLLLIERHCYQDTQNEFKGYSDFVNAAYLALCRFVVGIAYTCILLPVLLERIVVARAILGMKIWSPLSKLTYCAYLLHMVFVQIGIGSEVYAYNYTSLEVLLDFVFFLVLTYVGSAALYLIVEAPFNNITKAAFKKQKPRPEQLIQSELSAVTKG